MSSVRDTRTRLLTATAAVALAALSLTACGDGSGESDEGPSAGGSPAGSSIGSSTGSSTGSSSGSPSGSSSGKDVKSGGAGASGNKAVACKSSSTKTVASPVNRPVNHMLLTVTNTGSAPCDLYGFPAARFGEAQSVPRVNEDSRPQAVVTLAPGESGYAAVNLSATDGSGTNGHTVKALAVTFQDRAEENTSWVAHPSLPAEGVYVDDSLSVTYWQQSMDNALSW